MAKGSQFEREIARTLSLWWTGGVRDDVLYRSDSSGARATSRHKRGRSTANAHGDLCAKDPAAFPLLRLITWELKRGYSGDTVQDLLDAPGEAVQEYEGWFSHAAECAKLAGSVSWAVIVRRDKRAALIFYPLKLDLRLIGAGCVAMMLPRMVLFRELSDSIVGVPLEVFLKRVTPQHVLRALERYDEQKRTG